MDPAGAEALRDRLEQQRHWVLAPAVREGRQPRLDPDLGALLEIRGDERIYRDNAGSFVKRLSAGAWARMDIEPPWPGDLPAPE